MCCVNICAGLWLTVNFEKRTRQCDIDFVGARRGHHSGTPSRAPQPTRWSDTCEWNSQVLDPEMGSDPTQTQGARAAVPATSPFTFIITLARWRALSRINTNKGRENLLKSHTSDHTKAMYSVWRFPSRHTPLVWETPWRITLDRITYEKNNVEQWYIRYVYIAEMGTFNGSYLLIHHLLQT